MAVPDAVSGASDRAAVTAEFVLWWDTEAQRAPANHAGPGRGKKTSPQNGSGFLAPEDFGLTVKLISKWRTHLNDPHTSDAIDKKLTAQAEFVLWWDTEASRTKPGGPEGKRSPKNGITLQPEDFGLTVKLISKWRTHLNDPHTSDAIDKKLTAQAEFVLWWDTEAQRREAGGDRQSKALSRKRDDAFLSPEDFGLTVKLILYRRTRIGQRVDGNHAAA